MQNPWTDAIRQAILQCSALGMGLLFLLGGPSTAIAQETRDAASNRATWPRQGSADIPKDVVTACDPSYLEGQADATTVNKFRALSIEAYERGDWSRARDCLVRAQEIAPSARLLRAIGMVAFNQQDYVSAAASLQASLAEQREPLDAPLRSSAEQLLTRTREYVSQIELRLEPEAGVLTVDGAHCTRPHCAEFSPQTPAGGNDGSTSTDRVVVLRPGVHRIRYQSPGRQPWESSFTLEPGKDYVVAVILILPPGSGEPGGAVSWETKASPPSASIPKGDVGQGTAGSARAPGSANYWLVPAAGTAVSLAAAGVLSIVGQVRYEALKRQCATVACSHDDVDELNDLAFATNLALAGSAIFYLATVGTYWYEWSRGRPVRLLVGVNQLALQGQF